MSTLGTIDHPSTRDPALRHLLEQDPTMKTTDFQTPGRHRDDIGAARQKRTRDMQLMPESLARAHMDSRLREAESERRAMRVLLARRLQRRAERASLRARRAIAMAVMQ
ncbi:hypothetical protein [Streptomyces sp. JJ36]|uniref:hypothetical protein n=1 Tax=Streptomyces sp. JJ36 TaxID=2736645 RepID=UPI001F2B01A3|nr:hypothetical protein [Streptomyces sp. JJ36]MCF6523475.1 hypothetical protein [Streptomyces sp. JJ36]